MKTKVQRRLSESPKITELVSEGISTPSKSIYLYSLYSSNPAVLFSICLVFYLICIWQAQLSEYITHFLFGAT